MISIKIKNATHQIGKPENWKPSYGECESLHLRAEEYNGLKVLLSAWKPSKAELEELNAGGSIVLGVLGTVHPPVLMYTSSTD